MAQFELMERKNKQKIKMENQNGFPLLGSVNKDLKCSVQALLDPFDKMVARVMLYDSELREHYCCQRTQL